MLFSSLSGPDGQELLLVDLSPDQVVHEDILAVVETRGRYQITVKPAVAGTPAGRYLIRIEAVLLGTAEDVVRVGARRMLEAAVRLAQSNDTNEWQRAVQPLRWFGHEGEILRFVFWHSVVLACLLVFLQAYVEPFSWMTIR